MSSMKLKCIPILALLSLMASGAMPALARTCEDLARIALPGATITTAQSVPAGTFTPPEGKAIEHLPAFCRVAGVIKPTGDSQIQFEVWMPTAGWNGKFQGIGNGGFAGPIGFSSIGRARSHGSA